MMMNLYRMKEVGNDYIVLTDDATDVKVIFADRQSEVAHTKEEQAAFFAHILCQVGLEAPVVPVSERRDINIFMDHRVEAFGLLRSIPFPFSVSRIEVAGLVRSA